MKYICIWRDNCGGVQATSYESDNDEAAMTGLIDRCRSVVQIGEGAKIGTKIIVLPHLLIREDMTGLQLNYQISEDGEESLESLGELKF